jgi:lambda family phage minor tail protein L
MRLQHGISTTYRFHAGSNLNANGELVWAGNSYLASRSRLMGSSYSGHGNLPRPTLRIANLTGTITALLLTLPSGIEGAKVTRIRTLARYIDGVNFPVVSTHWAHLDPASFPPEIYYIDRKASENRDVIEFELACALILSNVRAPSGSAFGNICQWVYKSAECSYAGALPTCNKTVADCKAHFGATATLPFGSFPGIGSYFA